MIQQIERNHQIQVKVHETVERISVPVAEFTIANKQDVWDVCV